MIDDVLLNKKESIERCIQQIRKFDAIPTNLPFEGDFLKQDAIATNLQRAMKQSFITFEDSRIQSLLGSSVQKFGQSQPDW